MAIGVAGIFVWGRWADRAKKLAPLGTPKTTLLAGTLLSADQVDRVIQAAGHIEASNKRVSDALGCVETALHRNTAVIHEAIDIIRAPRP